MATILQDVEERRTQENELLRGLSTPRPSQQRGKSTGTFLKVVVTLEVIALGLLFVAGAWLARSMRRLDRRMAQVAQQTERLNRRVEGAEQQSQGFARQATQAAANAQAAAQQRDDAKQSEEHSAAEAQSARQAADAAQQKATQAEQKAEEYRKKHEEELQQLQGALGQIAETHRTAVGLVMTLGEKSIRFDTDKAEVKPQYRDVLNRVAGVLMTLKQYSIYVYGYTDDVGTQDYNLKLSARRAQSVRTQLIQAGIKPTVITTKGFGKSDPRVKGESAKARSANRRVEIGVVDTRLIAEPVSSE